MNYNYELLKVEPKQLWIQVRYYADGQPDQFKNLRATDFTAAGIRQAVEANAASVIATWNQIAAAPETPELTAGVTDTATFTEFTPTTPPEYDEFTEKLESGVDANNTQTWSVVTKSPAEQAEFLTQWRESTQVSMRQARLALNAQGLLVNVDAAIAGMSEPDRTNISIEWEYAAVVDRNSPWMAGMAVALGLTDEQMDDLFKLALTL